MDIHIPFVFFGTPEYSVKTLEALEVRGYSPNLIVTSPDAPVGRHQTLTSSPVKLWGESHRISVLTPEKINEEFYAQIEAGLFDVFIVAAYGKILPQQLLDMPKFGTLNVHPSLLPLYRGASPLEGPILNGDSNTGVTIIKIDSDIDHGPILAQEMMPLLGDEKADELGKKLFYRGGEMLADILPSYIDGTLPLREQDHSGATFTKKLKKDDGLVRLTDDPTMLWRKFRAYYGWPGIYFMDKGNKRVKITDAQFVGGEFKILKVIPEGKKELPYKEFSK